MKTAVKKNAVAVKRQNAWSFIASASKPKDTV